LSSLSSGSRLIGPWTSPPDNTSLFFLLFKQSEQLL
jgi:hypothetical protein